MQSQSNNKHLPQISNKHLPQNLPLSPMLSYSMRICGDSFVCHIGREISDIIWSLAFHIWLSKLQIRHNPIQKYDKTLCIPKKTCIAAVFEVEVRLMSRTQIRH
eukprot:272833_1